MSEQSIDQSTLAAIVPAVNADDYLFVLQLMVSCSYFFCRKVDACFHKPLKTGMCTLKWSNIIIAETESMHLY